MQATSAGASGDEMADVDGMKAVHVFRGDHRVENFLGVNLLGQRHLHQNSVHVVAIVQLVDDGEQFVGGGRGGRSDVEAAETQFFARRDFAVHVELRRRIVPHAHGRQAGANPLARERGDFRLQLGINLVSNCVAIENARGQRMLLM